MIINIMCLTVTHALVEATITVVAESNSSFTESETTDILVIQGRQCPSSTDEISHVNEDVFQSQITSFNDYDSFGGKNNLHRLDVKV